MNPYFESEYGESRMMHGCPGLIHVVKEGDTLYKISQYHHVSVTDILLANPYVNVYNLQIGDELCIPDFGCRRCKETKGENLDEKRADEMQSLS